MAIACTSFQAPEIKGIKAWINNEPLTIEKLRGNVVLVDFWTYSCVNCIRTFPALKQWHAKYADDGLVIIGVHSPEFEFEKDYDNVLKATQDNGITWPVAQDNDFETWDNYSNRFWPAKYLIDKDGLVQYTHFGEGAYDETEKQIRDLLIDAGASLSDTPLVPIGNQQVDQSFFDAGRASVTRELYAGFVLAELGEYVRQEDFFKNTGSVVEMKSGGDFKPGVIYFDGQWVAWPEHTSHGRDTTGYEDALSLIYSARSLNVVLSSDSGEPYNVRIKVNGEFLTEENKGADVTISANGESLLNVIEPRMYSVIEDQAYTKDNLLTMSSNSDDFSVFAFTFGAYEKGP
ncbi:MAG: thiol-disulfide isomerase [Chloroflexi bacterium]|nr:thiol-disulfide isomerase [Chloroflexota bacterium]MQG54682.1 thioredoxin family protein [SAR202 cluster bacterium]|tara:strand:+ start:15219 stop:16256 length:1038 start_codon:yes stop_codon:yes gene_type:complete